MSKLVKLSDYTCGSRLAVMRLVIAFKSEKNEQFFLLNFFVLFSLFYFCTFLQRKEEKSA